MYSQVDKSTCWLSSSFLLLLKKWFFKNLRVFEKKMIFSRFSETFKFFDHFYFYFFLDFGFFNFLYFLFIFFIDFFKLLRLLLKVTKVTTGEQKWPKVGQNSIINFLGAKKSLGRSPPQKLEVGPRSEPYLLVYIKSGLDLEYPM